MLSVGSLFSGIGGFDLGLERAGMRVLWQCEIDPYCQRVLEKHWPDVLRVPDIRELRAGTVPAVDVLAGGFPCQDLSWAGPGAGIGGARSGLWSEYARLVGEFRPRYVLVENVAALLARGMGVVLGDLAALGYDAEWDCIPASAIGAPHQRDRVWLVAYPSRSGGATCGTPGTTEDRPDAGSGRAGGGRGTDVADAARDLQAGPPAPWSERERARQGCERGREDVADAEVVTIRAGLREDESRGLGRGRPSDGGSPGDWWLTEPDVGRVAHGVPARVDRLRSLGNALVPQIAEWIGQRVVAYEEGQLDAA